ncbi:DinB family protein [Pontimicrobium aquaticum]|uniref:DinB family protein n=1 Tax=Pontimicrobium aquaticum TaxID=2565367 RepID=A0A4U0EP84_9FLAO|nr:DinB family protein [Pontimicrobium aquaticum]TJY33445.1 DinB family protein [Pontimicrobium aquaticum]
MIADTLSSKEFNSYYKPYINLVNESDIVLSLQQSFDETITFLSSIPDDKWLYSYAKGKWTIKEIIQHILDTERVFAYRAMCFSRKESIALPGFDQDMYLENSNANTRTKDGLIEEYKAIRNASITLYKSFTKQMLLHVGIASDNPLSVRAAGYIIVGHEKHHCNIIKARYL